MYISEHCRKFAIVRPDPKEPVVGEGEMGGPTIELPAISTNIICP